MARTARIDAGQGPVPAVVRDDGTVVAADGREHAPDGVTWLPPTTGTCIGLALNYRAHAAELEHELTRGGMLDHPILFIKNPSSLTGHMQPVVRPDGVEYMHYEAELGVVIGQGARGVARHEAMQVVAGYTACNDFTVRDFVEDFYRPPVKAKGFDSFGPMGPWVTDASDVDDPHALTVRTYVNGTLRQEGNTAELVFDIPALIEYVTAFMTLRPGDVIWTGTPQGLSNVAPGDEVQVVVEGVATLTNSIVAENHVGFHV